MRPSVLVVPFSDGGMQPGNERLTLGFTDQIVAGLTRFREIVVYGRAWASGSGPVGDPLQQAQSVGASHLLEGTVAATTAKVRVTIRLHAVADGAIAWSNTYDAELRGADLFAIQDRIAADVALRIAQPYGLLAHTPPRPNAHPDDFDAYHCILDFYACRRTFAREQQPKVVECLERTVSRHPDFATGWAMLALLRIDNDRFGLPAAVGGPAPLEAAIVAARRAIALDSSDVRAWQALMLASYLRSDVAEGRAAGERALQLNPNDLDLVAEFGARLALAGDWARGTAMIRSVVDRDPGIARLRLTVLAVDAIRRGQFQEAVDLLDRSGIVGNPTVEFVRASALGHLGRRGEAQAAGQRALATLPGFVDRLDAEFTKRNLQPEVRRALLEGWRRAGLPMPPSAGSSELTSRIVPKS
jgi:TolB-like protein